MVARVIHLIRLLIVLASGHRHLVLENLALRQQLAVYRRTRPKPAIRGVCLFRLPIMRTVTTHSGRGFMVQARFAGDGSIYLRKQ